MADPSSRYKPDELVFIIMVLLHSPVQMYAGVRVWKMNSGTAGAEGWTLVPAESGSWVNSSRQAAGARPAQTVIHADRAAFCYSMHSC